MGLLLSWQLLLPLACLLQENLRIETDPKASRPAADGASHDDAVSAS